jgi:hypothetical protein
MDMDQFEKKEVMDAVAKIKLFCYENGIFYYNETWNRKFKGIDDYRYHLASESNSNLTTTGIRCKI